MDAPTPSFWIVPSSADVESDGREANGGALRFAAPTDVVAFVPSLTLFHFEHPDPSHGTLVRGKNRTLQPPAHAERHAAGAMHEGTPPLLAKAMS